MIGIENLITFIFTALFFIMTPGIDTVYVLNKSIENGRRSGFYAVLGVNSGVLIHTLLGALGFSVFIAQSVYVFAFIKYIGAIYLIYLGFVKLKEGKGFLLKNELKQGRNTANNDFWSGFLTNTLNPKVALFFLAFFPQFINSTQMDNPIPFILLGFTYALIGVVWFFILTVFASAFSQKIKNNPKTNLWLSKLSGLVFVVMGIKIALTQK